jgi:hypothetical protein
MPRKERKRSRKKKPEKKPVPEEDLDDSAAAAAEVEPPSKKSKSSRGGRASRRAAAEEENDDDDGGEGDAKPSPKPSPSKSKKKSSGRRRGAAASATDGDDTDDPDAAIAAALGGGEEEEAAPPAKKARSKASAKKSSAKKKASPGKKKSSAKRGSKKVAAPVALTPEELAARAATGGSDLDLPLQEEYGMDIALWKQVMKYCGVNDALQLIRSCRALSATERQIVLWEEVRRSVGFFGRVLHARGPPPAPAALSAAAAEMEVDGEAAAVSSTKTSSSSSSSSSSRGSSRSSSAAAAEAAKALAAKEEKAKKDLLAAFNPLSFCRAKEQHASTVRSLMQIALPLTKDPPLIASASSDHTLKLWDHEGVCVRTMGKSSSEMRKRPVHDQVPHMGHSGPVMCLSAAFGWLIASAGADEEPAMSAQSTTGMQRMGKIRLWSSGATSAFTVLHGHRGAVSSVIWIKGSRLLLSAAEVRQVLKIHNIYLVVIHILKT